jgi:nucleoside-diphosphate-sugar epimerase
MRVLITGSSGFVGRSLLSRLTDAEVRCAVRAQPAEESRHDWRVVGSIDGRTDWRRALEGVDCVVHLAARVHVMRPTAADRHCFYETNVAGTERLAAQAAAQGVRRFIYLSSIKVNGESTQRQPFRAEDAPAPCDDYGISKWQAEQRLFEIAQRFEMEAVAIRPPLVYGSGVRANFLRLMRWVNAGIPLPLGAVQNRRSMVSVWNLCDLIATLAFARTVSSGVLMVSDGVDMSTPDLVCRLAAAMGRKARLLPLPTALLERMAAVLGKKDEVVRLCGSLTVDISETERRIGWRPPLPVEEGLERTVHWFLAEAASRD